MRVRLVDRDNEAEFERYYAIIKSAYLADRDQAPIFTSDELRVYLDGSVNAEIVTGYVGFDGDSDDEEMVAAAFTFHSATDNVDMTGLNVYVEPERRGRGLGSALLTHLIDRSVAEGRHTLVIGAWIPFERREDHPYRRFAEKHGFALANVEIRRVLDLPVPDREIEAWAEEAAPHHSDYRLQTFFGAVPDEHLPSLCHVMNQLGVDAPTGDIELEARALTPDVYKAREARNAQAGKEMLRTLAFDAAGETVGFTTMAIPRREKDIVYQYGTLVRRDHRGYRLGMAMKAAALRALQAAYPDRTYIDTSNAEQNGPMVDINDRIGFRPVEILADFQRIITSDS